ncbi:MAG: cytochrome c [Novosphingobium sp.]
MRFLLAAAPLLALGLSACGNPDTPAGRAADSRHEIFEHIGDAFKIIADQLKAPTPDIGKIQAAAATINGFAPKVETWFPAGSGPADGLKTDALQTVWTKPDQFKQATAKFVEEAAKFQALAQAGNVGALGEGMKGLGGACKNCHDQFREKD